MQKRRFLIYLTAVIAMLFTTIYQPLHEISHLAESWKTRVCKHDYSHNKHEITHQHKLDDRCIVCHFNLGNFLTTSVQKIQFSANICSKRIFFFKIACGCFSLSGKQIFITRSTCCYCLTNRP